MRCYAGAKHTTNGLSLLQTRVMIRQIIIPHKNQHVIQLPDEMLGKQVEVIAFEVPANEPEVDASTLVSFQKSFEENSFPTKGWEFNRDEANDYD
jgi:hypothetical protein